MVGAAAREALVKLPTNTKAWVAPSAGALVLTLAGALAGYYEGTRHTSYPDPSGNGMWTICQGHTKGVQPGQHASDAECAAFLQNDMQAAYADVQRCITYPIPVTVQAAFTDAAYNVGVHVVCGSSLQRLANGGDIRGACEQLTRWDKADGKIMPGLVRRRQAERDLCLNGLQ